MFKTRGRGGDMLNTKTRHSGHVLMFEMSGRGEGHVEGRGGNAPNTKTHHSGRVLVSKMSRKGGGTCGV